jgi:hypothetical protein
MPEKIITGTFREAGRRRLGKGIDHMTLLIRRRGVSSALLSCIVPTLLAAPQTPPDSAGSKTPFRIPHVEAPISVDGVMDEPFWSEALVVPADIEVRPGENIEAPVKTEAYLVYNTASIYVGLKCHDPRPSEIRAHLCDRDNLWDDDWVLILFDTFNDQRRTYDFFCNPLGIQADEIESTTGGGGSWDAIWESSGRITDEGYVVEMKIPFRALGFPRSREDQIWGFDVVRSLPRNVRHHIGAFPRDRGNNCYMCQALKMIGFAGATPGRNIEFDPTVSAVRTQIRENETSGPFHDKEKKLDPGLTAKWGFTPNLTLGGTLNPDFSNVEADIIQLDINRRFSLYYPEKRPFFLEGADFFSTPFFLVNTRALAEPDWGLKLTGKEGGNAIGFYTVRDAMTNLIFPGAEGSSDHSTDTRSQGTVLRYRRDLGKSSNIGIVLTDREGDGYHNRVGGLDGDVKFTPKDELVFQVTRSLTHYPDSLASQYGQRRNEFGGLGYSLLYQHNTRTWQAYQLVRRVDPGFRADLGFMTMVGFTYAETGGSLKWQRDPGSWFNWINLYGSYDRRYDTAGNPLHRALTSRFNYNGPMQSSLTVYGEHGRDMYLGRTYRAEFAETYFYIRPSGLLAADLYFHSGDRIDYENCRPGRHLQLSGTLYLRLGLHLSMEAGHTRDRLNVENGKRLYTADIDRLRLMYQFSKRMYLRTIFQYEHYRKNAALYAAEGTNSKTEGLFSQVLFSYKINPQTVFFLGYSDNYYGDQNIRIVQTNRTVFAKIGYAYML